MIKLYKSLEKSISDSKFEKEICDGTISFVSWERLKPYVEHAIGKTPREKIVGIEITQDGLTVKIERIKK